jgi:hypothetical protein
MIWKFELYFTFTTLRNRLKTPKQNTAVGGNFTESTVKKRTDKIFQQKK